MLHHFETTAISRPEHSSGLLSGDPLERRLGTDDFTMLAFTILAAVGAAVLLLLGF